ncbi:MAG: methionyl-tRNA formyltransferase [Spirochaetes bacterium]|nr:methionyl-tRNA formyltransferase [Spirochaetota bacterium]
MKTIFLGSTDFTRVCLEAALAAGADIAMLICQPDTKKDRHGGIVELPVSAFARERGIPLLQPENINEPDVVSQIKALSSDLFVVVAYGQILKQPVLDIPRLGAVNVHASLLPKYRGASPIEHALLNGDAFTGVTLQKIALKMDVGDIVSQEKITIEPSWDYTSLYEAVKQAGARLVKDLYRDPAGSIAAAVAQNEHDASYCWKVKKEDAHIDWTRSAISICNMVRAYAHWPVAYTGFRGKMLKVYAAKPADDRLENTPVGSIIVHARNKLLVQTGDGVLSLTEVQWEGKRRQTAKDFINGARIGQEHLA